LDIRNIKGSSYKKEYKYWGSPKDLYWSPKLSKLFSKDEINDRMSNFKLFSTLIEKNEVFDFEKSPIKKLQLDAKISENETIKKIILRRKINAKSPSPKSQKLLPKSRYTPSIRIKLREKTSFTSKDMIKSIGEKLNVFFNELSIKS